MWFSSVSRATSSEVATPASRRGAAASALPVHSTLRVAPTKRKWERRKSRVPDSRSPRYGLEMRDDAKPVLDYRSLQGRPARMPWSVLLRDVIVVGGGLLLLVAIWVVMSLE